MQNVLLLGAGLVTRPLVRYLLERGVHLTIADRAPEKAEALIDKHPGGKAISWLADDHATLHRLLADHELVISLLPASMHPMVAERCIEHRCHMITASYVSPEMRALEQRALDAEVLLLNELGVDPGIDHMSAMRVIHGVQGRGGRVTTFRSYCGGLPAPDDNNNPWGYKFSWSPLGVLRAATNSARYRKNDVTVEIPPQMLFCDTHRMEIPTVGRLESYPNRDSLGYKELYGLQGVGTMFRGTLRYPGWSRTLRRVVELGLLDTTHHERWVSATWAELIAHLVGCRPEGRLRERVAAFLWLPPDDPTIEKLAWLGLFEHRPLPLRRGSVMEQLSEAMQRQMMYAPGEKDMIVMRHEFVAEVGGELERISSTMVDFGIPNGDSAMARTVSLPAAIAARMVLEGKIQDRGVHIPIKPEVYTPILDELAELGIALKEETTPL